MSPSPPLASRAHSEPRAVVRAPGGALVELAHGALIGRLRRCELFLDDARLSEAHALVSLRGDGLQLLPLRGRLLVDGAPVSEVRLVPGARVELARGVALEVLEVVLPEDVLALSLDGGPPLVLAGTASLVAEGPRLSLRSGWVADALATLWNTEGAWRLARPPGGAPETIHHGQAWTIHGVRVEAVSLPLVDAGVAPTRADPELELPLRIVARYQSVHVHAGGRERLVLDGAPAAILSELIALRGPAGWDVVAREVWRKDVPAPVLRSRWDTALHRLRARLRQAGLPPSLVRSDRHGFVEFVPGPRDEVIDET